MNDVTWLAARFEEQRGHLRAVAYRLLGSQGEADDAVQEAWLRLARTDAAAIENLTGWLTTVVSRVCLDVLRARKARREEALELRDAPPRAAPDSGPDPEAQAVMADVVGLALVAVLDRLAPPERVAFVLHDLFGLSFDEIAPIVGRTTIAARKLASRARQRVQGAGGPEAVDRQRQRTVVAAFLAAARGGSLEGLLALLDPDVVLRADPAAVTAGATAIVRGAADVAKTFAGRARVAQPALVDGVPGAMWAPGGTPRVVFAFTLRDDRIVGIDLLADPDHLSELSLEPVATDEQ